MFDTLSGRLARVVKTLRGQARLTEANTQDMLREVRLALLEADVALPVVKTFIAAVKEKAVGEEVASSLTPGQALVGVVDRELAALLGADLGPEACALNFAVQPPAVFLMAGLQGSGKTTTTGKLAKWLSEGASGPLAAQVASGRPSPKKVLVVSCDVYRPAAIEQLRTVAQAAGVECFPSQPDQAPLAIAAAALDHARRYGFEVLIVDTAGRLGIDAAMMQEIAQLHAALQPAETLFVVDSMLGQDAINTAQAFQAHLPLTGIVLTKTDGDARGGAALSVRQITGKPIKFIGVSEKLTGIEAFSPQRMAQRILGMGDILSLVEQAQRGIDVEQAERFAQKIKSGDDFDLNDFLSQIGQMRQMGDLSSIMEKLPTQMTQGAGPIDSQAAERQVRRMQGIIHAMTPLERSKPDLIKATRKRRIAQGAGVQVQEVNRLLAQFEQLRGVMKQMRKGGMGKLMRALGGMSGMMGGGSAASMLGKLGGGAVAGLNKSGKRKH